MCHTKGVPCTAQATSCCVAAWAPSSQAVINSGDKSSLLSIHALSRNCTRTLQSPLLPVDAIIADIVVAASECSGPRACHRRILVRSILQISQSTGAATGQMMQLESHKQTYRRSTGSVITRMAHMSQKTLPNTTSWGGLHHN